MRKNKKNRKNKDVRVALRNLANLYNNYPENRKFLPLELEEEKILAC